RRRPWPVAAGRIRVEVRTMSKPSSRLLVVATMLVIGVFGGAGAHAAPPTDQRSAVQALLDSPAARYLTPQALLSLRAMANPDHALGADPSFDQGSPQAASRPEAAPGAAPESAGLRNVRVNNPGEDTHQTDQTTQSETSIAAAGS